MYKRQKQGLSDKDLEALQDIEGIVGFAPTVTATIDIPNKGSIAENIVLDGKNEVYFRRNPDIVVEGRGINILDIENRNRVCVISREMEQKLFMGESGLNQRCV